MHQEADIAAMAAPCCIPRGRRPVPEWVVAQDTGHQSPVGCPLHTPSQPSVPPVQHHLEGMSSLLGCQQVQPDPTTSLFEALSLGSSDQPQGNPLAPEIPRHVEHPNLSNPILCHHVNGQAASYLASRHSQQQLLPLQKPLHLQPVCPGEHPVVPQPVLPIQVGFVHNLDDPGDSGLEAASAAVPIRISHAGDASGAV
eukprot:CAMPEP_0117651164 /NCGR_PEP_ID=MMETSP0804-20121206/1943_1 /TAXON_ID=1074897 /ORGANISM="Tetraselmis astigmatica, Strain CCMP880" /LENGTH=197 /DNA_ID=CAMNT_0005457117 /DNA_START=363 /DNA_END=957 /DNA_ORIENTATION=-